MKQFYFPLLPPPCKFILYVFKTCQRGIISFYQYSKICIPVSNPLYRVSMEKCSHGNFSDEIPKTVNYLILGSRNSTSLKFRLKVKDRRNCFHGHPVQLNIFKARASFMLKYQIKTVIKQRKSFQMIINMF